MKYKTYWLAGLLAPMLVAHTALAVQSDFVCGTTATMFLDKGALYGMGDNSRGLLMPGSGGEYRMPLYLGEQNIATLAMTTYRAAIVKTDGTAVLRGYNYTTYVNSDLVPFPEAGIVDVALTNTEVFYITEARDLMRWSGNHGAAPTLLASNVKTVSAGLFHVAFVKQNSNAVYTLATNASLGNAYGQLGNGGLAPDGTLQPIFFARNVAELRTSDYSVWARDESGQWHSWGRNMYGELGTGDQVNHPFPYQVALPMGTWQVVPMAGTTALIGSDGTLKMIGWHNHIGGGTSYNVTQNWETMPVGKVSAGCTHMGSGGTMFRRPEYPNEVGGWGSNLFGKLGDGTNTERHSLVSAFFTPVIVEPPPPPVVVVEPAPVEVAASAPEPVVDTAIATPFNPEPVPSGDATPVPTVVETVVNVVVDAVLTVADTVTTIVNTVVDAIVEVIAPPPPPPAPVPEPVVVPPPVVVLPPAPAPAPVTHANNGFGNGDQAAPGKSATKNHAENDEHGDDHGDREREKIKKVEVKKVEVKSTKIDDRRHGRKA